MNNFIEKVEFKKIKIYRFLVRLPSW